MKPTGGAKLILSRDYNSIKLRGAGIVDSSVFIQNFM